MLCRHCHLKPVSRPRGLCWGCYYRPGIRELYPSTSKYARRGIGNGDIGVMQSATHTTAAPGSPEKIAVLAERAARGEKMDHPDNEAVLCGLNSEQPSDYDGPRTRQTDVREPRCLRVHVSDRVRRGMQRL